MKRSIVITALVLVVPAPAAWAGGIVNGDFEDPAPVHPEWHTGICNDENTPQVKQDGPLNCSYAQMGPLNTDFCEYQSLGQGFTAACVSPGNYVTIQFDFRTYTSLPDNQVVDYSVGTWSTSRTLPTTGGAWQTRRISLPGSMDPFAAHIEFRIANQVPGACNVLVPLRLDIDNVVCYATQEDVTNLCDRADPIGCLCFSCAEESSELFGAGQACTSDPGCAGDLDGSCDVGYGDILIVLRFWGDCDSCDCCPGDANGDCVVDYADILEVLASWGPCDHAPCYPTTCE